MGREIRASSFVVLSRGHPHRIEDAHDVRTSANSRVETLSSGMWLAPPMADDGPNAVAREVTMKDRRRLAVLAPLLGLLCAIAPPPADAGSSFGLYVGGSGFGVSVGFGDWGVYTQSWSDPYWSIDFNAVLAGYGEWVWVDGLGRVWRPWVAASWRPYTYGRWVATDFGWTWVAYEPWGFVPHHYGSWAYCNFGWVWQPGYTYSCANVTWVRTGGYIGWYARPPYGWSHAAHGFKQGYRDGYRNGYIDGSDRGWNDARYGTYVGWDDFGSEDVSHRQVAHRIASQSRLVDDNAKAPSGQELRQRGSAVPIEAALSQRTVTMGGREVRIARPEGVSRSIERHAADTVSSALAPAALEQRQPLVQPRTASATAAASSAGTEVLTRTTSSRQFAPSTRPATSLPTERSGIPARSANDRPAAGGTSQTRTAGPISSRPAHRVVPEDSVRDLAAPRAAADSEVTTRSRSHSTTSETIRAQQGTASRQAGQTLRQTSEVQQRQVQNRQPVSDRSQDAPIQQPASASRRPQSSSGKSAAATENENPPRRRPRPTSRTQ
jgi:hypothetical protein